MNYFVDINLGSALTGIEKAQFNRLKLFQKANIPATLLYLGYNSRLHEYTKKFDVQGLGFSMYDYFQKATDYADYGHFDWQGYWEKQRNFRLEYIKGANDIRVFDEQDRRIMYAHFLDEDYTRVDYINYFNPNHAKIRRDVYDSRGFLSRTSMLADQGLINTELYFDRDENIRIIKQCEPVDGKSVLRQITLKNYHQRDYLFSSEGEFQTFFLNELYQKGDMYFCDRNSAMARPFYNTNPEVKVTAVFHSTHVRVGQDILTGTLKRNIYDFTLEHPEKLERIIVSTEQQKKDLIARFSNLPPVVVIPVGFAEPHEVDFENRNPHRIISVARYSPEKQLMHQVKAVERLVPDFPDVELHLLGFGQKVEKEIRAYITEHKLTRNVLIRGFKKDLSDEYRQASVALMTSIEEGFSLSTLEGLSYSVPVIGYNIHYGPNEMIIDGENGFLVPADNQELLYQKLHDYLESRDLQLQLMANCHRSISRYSPENVMGDWQAFVKEVSENPR